MTDRLRAVPNDPQRNERAETNRRLILACKAGKDWWDVLGAVTYLERDWTGRAVWRRYERCQRCGSTRISVYPPGKMRTQDRIGGYRYDRPPGWYDIQLYYGDAYQALVDEGALLVTVE